MGFSVCMSVYQNDNPVFLIEALDSIINQTCCPDEIVLVEDGQITKELETVICDYELRFPFMNIIRNEKNQGLGVALRIAVENAKNELIARMDSDDISTSGRFESQLHFLHTHPEVDIVGGQMTEFINSPHNIVSKRLVPIEHNDIVKYMKSRCGMNHVTVMFRKSAVLKVGNYQEWLWNEDYYLWVRMIAAGCQFANLPNVLVNVRTGKDQYARRGGKKYFHSEYGIQKYMFEHQIISCPRFLFNILVRWCVQILMPNWLRGWVFRTLFRNR